jgi:hypothetical protein
MAGFEGSNPFRPIQPSVQIPKKNKNNLSTHDRLKTEHKKRTEIYNNLRNKDEVGVVIMRDLYNRKAKLDYWIQRVNTGLLGTDKSDLVKLIEHMQDKERAALWIIRCITALISIRKQLGKPFKDATKDDIKLILKWMKEIKLQNRLEKRYGSKFTNDKSKIKWIEILLQTPIDDYRKNAVALIVAPYLINIRKVSYEESFLILKGWLTKCAELRKLDDDFEYTLKYSLSTAARKQRLPMKFDTLKTKNSDLHAKLSILISKHD